MKNMRLSRFARFLFAFISAFLLCILVTALVIQNKSQIEAVQMEQIVLDRTNKVNNVITKLLYKTQVLSALVIQNDGKVGDFERVAATIIDDPSIKNVILAPDGVVTNVYPLEGNEQVVGLDYFSEGEGNIEAIQARNSGQLVLGGPFNLVQGGQALVGRLPIYIKTPAGDSRFWGLVSVTLNYPAALDGAELGQLKELGYTYEIWRVSPDTNQRQTIASGDSPSSTNSKYVEMPLNILNAQWHFRISPLRMWYEFPETWVFLASGFIISLLFGCLILHNFDLSQMKKTLEDLSFSDSLTGTKNRRGIFREIEQLIGSHKASFVLSYMDLDNFKKINDTYGHSVGDNALERFTQAFLKHMDKHDLLGRIGGDEFVLICSGDDAVEHMQVLLAKAREELAHVSISPRCAEENIYFSVGWAVYPGDGSTADELLRYADAAMYRHKTTENKASSPS